MECPDVCHNPLLGCFLHWGQQEAPVCLDMLLYSCHCSSKWLENILLKTPTQACALRPRRQILGQQRQRTCSSFRVCQSSPGPSFLPSLLYSLTALLCPPHHCLIVLLRRTQMFTVLSAQSLRLKADYTTSCIYNIV